MTKQQFSSGAMFRGGAPTIALVLFTLFAARAGAQGEMGSVSGRITDEDGAPLGGANVTISDTKRGTVSRMNGEYELDSLAAGAHTLQVRLMGYRTRSQPVTVSAGDRVKVDIALASDPLDSSLIRGVCVPVTTIQIGRAHV